MLLYWCYINIFAHYLLNLYYVTYSCFMYQKFKLRNLNLFDEILCEEFTEIEMMGFFSPYWGF